MNPFIGKIYWSSFIFHFDFSMWSLEDGWTLVEICHWEGIPEVKRPKFRWNVAFTLGSSRDESKEAVWGVIVEGFCTVYETKEYFGLSSVVRGHWK